MGAYAAVEAICIKQSVKRHKLRKSPKIDLRWQRGQDPEQEEPERPLGEQPAGKLGELVGEQCGWGPRRW